MKKKAFTLIELIISVSIASIIFSLEIKVLAREIRSFSRIREDTVSYSSISEGLNFIHKVLYGNGRVQVNNDTIEIINEKKNKKGCIKLQENALKIEYEDINSNTGRKNSNNICRKIKDFQVRKNGKVLFIKISDKNGRECSRFIPVEN
ncbi:prepilin-type N-terminal cleavage/methylation domain-containing protein [Clostridium sp. KNHs214]|uniref:prepilin-type N-terminal cleavage/methylation domain-containing protein n=1 Tax=Clostridium sp. KNHs214 TaxID=1540257 RepID=UPI000552B846|nr:prepilin-type N-terminal cleavage/methylation domain-containing protein [Clostridium sp. KNHs214]